MRPIALPDERPGHPAPPDLAGRRAQMAGAIAAGLFATRRPPREQVLGALRVLRFAPDEAPRGLVLHLHGGGFRQGAPEFAGPFAEALAARCGVEVVLPQYRLAPEHPFPAGLADGLAALRALAGEAEDLPLILSGDSAGAGLAAGLAVWSAANGGPPVAGLVLLSPWLDLTVTARSYVANAASDPLFSRDSAQEAAGLYLQGLDPRHPLASPLFAPLAGLPPCLVSVGAGEVLRDDALRFHAMLEHAGVPARLCVVEGMDHVAVVRGMDLPGAAQTFEAVAAFIDEVIG